MPPRTRHTPVLSHECIELLRIRPGSVAVDGTVGSGGHALAIAEALDYRGSLFCIDRDPQALVVAEAAFAESPASRYRSLAVRFSHASYREIGDVLRQSGDGRADAILVDLGFSSDTLVRGRGFSFQRTAGKEPLDMRYDPGEACPTAADVVNRVDAGTLARILSTYGEERFAPRIARSLVQARARAPLTTVADLVETVVRAIPPAARHGSLHVATRTFQALRVAVNREIDHLEAFLADLPNMLAPGGIAAVISFHSLEDRAVKQGFRSLAEAGVGTVCTPKPVVPGADEIRRNPPSRSAKLRAFQKS